ncbi:hypothetical protein SLS56_007794 [Neofusicoccum ribis]|uniref:Glycoside hydrolase family 71 protein n=1 Tax=Neofusicoccum ribis TaxID=45134 RepID=A0ABR3SLU5_9PEZI
MLTTFQVGDIHEDHVHQDVDDAAAMGLDGFALNIGEPTQNFSRAVFDYMFDYTRDNHPDFKLFISMDLWSDKNLSDFDSFFTDFLAHDAYYKGPNGFPFASTYGDGGYSKDVWKKWKDSWADKLYFVPDFAGLLGSSNDTADWWDDWGDIVDGLFSWESVWPLRGQANTLSIADDDDYRASTSKADKSYMVGLSMLQYKNSYGANIYRAGEDNLSNRIHNILNMTTAPDFAQLLTWNDGPESHYIGTIWPEQNNDTEPNLYATQRAAPHNAIQPLLASFTQAFKRGLSSGDMAPANDSTDAVGALWFKPILASTACANEDDGNLHHEKPDGYDVAVDVAAWAVVVAPDAVDAGRSLTLRGFSGGEAMPQDVELTAGLNFGNFSTLRSGAQCMEVRDADGKVVFVASGSREVSDDCPDGIYNLNPQILGLSDDVSAGGCQGEKSSSDGGDDGDDESWGVRVGLDKVCLLSALLVSLALVM